MSFPSRIGAQDEFHIGFNAQHSGPFEISTNLYAFLVNETSGIISAMKSADGGATWTEQNAAGRPSIYIALSFGKFNVDVVQSGSTFYVLYLDTSGNAAIASFAGDTWGSTITGGPLIGGTIISTPGPPIVVARASLCLLRRSNGDFLVFWGRYLALVTAGDGFSRDVSGVVYSGAWGSTFPVSSTSMLYHCAIDSGDRAYIFMQSVTQGATADTITLRTYTSGGILSGSDLTVVDNMLSRFGCIGASLVYTPPGGGETVGFAYSMGVIWNPGDLSYVGHAALATALIADTPTFGFEQINYLNNPGEEQGGSYIPVTSDLATCIKDGLPTVFWLGRERLPFSLFSNSKTAYWLPLNIFRFQMVNNADAAAVPVNVIDAPQGRYLTGRAKFGILLVLGFSPAIDYGENGYFYNYSSVYYAEY